MPSRVASRFNSGTLVTCSDQLHTPIVNGSSAAMIALLKTKTRTAQIVIGRSRSANRKTISKSEYRKLVGFEFRHSDRISRFGFRSGRTPAGQAPGAGSMVQPSGPNFL